MALTLCVLSAGLVAGATHGPDDSGDRVEASYPLDGLPEYRTPVSTSTTRPATVAPDLGSAGPDGAGAPAVDSTPASAPTPTPTPTTTTTSPPPPVSTTPPTTAVPPSTCGPAIAKTDGSPWQCTFADDFNGSELDRSKWTVHVSGVNGFPIGRECRIDAPRNIEVADGTLELFVREEPAAIDCAEGDKAFRTRYSGSTISTAGRFSQTYGRVEVRARVVGATEPGLHSAIWMWPQNFSELGDYGEIDIAEMYSLHPDRAIPYLHYNGTVIDSKATNNYCVVGDVADWHDYVLEWTPRQIEIIYDGQTCLRNRWNLLTGLVQAFDQDFYVILTQALGVGGNEFRPGQTPLPASTEFDHVRVWE